MTASPAGTVPARDARAHAPLRVVHVIDALVLAGMEYGVIKVSNRIDRTLVDPAIVCLRHQADATKGVLDPTVDVVTLLAATKRNWGLILRLAAVFRRQRARVVHAHNWQTYLYATLAARLAGVPVVIHGEHGHDVEAPSARRLAVKRALAPLVTRFVAVSEDLARELVRDWKLRPERIVCIANGVDLSQFEAERTGAETRRDLGIDPDELVVTNVGGIRHVKDHPTLVRAFARVRAARPEARLLIVGSDYHRGLKAKLVELAESLGVAEAIVFTGIRKDIPDLLAATDVYVNASVFEGMSNTILEAMAMGKPVVATAVGGNVELVEDGRTGLLVPPSDPERLGGAIERLLADGALRASMGREGRARIERRHAMAGMVRGYSDLYLETWARDRLRRHAPAREWVKRAAARASRWAVALGAGRAADERGPHPLTIVTYHRVLPLHEASRYPFQGMVMPRDAFEHQVAHLARRYRVLPFPEAVERLRSGTLPPRAVAITFDDGYRDNYLHAFPALRRWGIPACFFVVTDVLDRTLRLWWDEVAAAEPADAVRRVSEWNAASRAERAGALESWRRVHGSGPEDRERLMMSWDDVEELHRHGMTIGTHSRSHAFLDELDEAEAFAEVKESAERIEERLGAPARWLAYPRGRAVPGGAELLRRAGMEAAVTVEPGRNSAGCDPYALRRVDAGYFRTSAVLDPAVVDAELSGALGRLRRA